MSIGKLIAQLLLATGDEKFTNATVMALEASEMTNEEKISILKLSINLAAEGIPAMQLAGCVSEAFSIASDLKVSLDDAGEIIIKNFKMARLN